MRRKTRYLTSDNTYIGPVLPPLGETLFYPCSGSDFIEPIQLFKHIIDDFVFVDRGYFTPGHQDTRRHGLDVLPEDAELVLKDFPEFEFVSRNINRPPRPEGTSHRKVYPSSGSIEPCVLTERYFHRPLGRYINIHRRRGYGFSALRKEIFRVRVFFYRGDSLGEGGSGNFWLAKGHMEELLEKMNSDSYIVTDGSNGSSSSLYSFLYPLRDAKRSSTITDDDVVSRIPLHCDSQGRIFRCVGEARPGYGPTLIWNVKIPAPRRTWPSTSATV